MKSFFTPIVLAAIMLSAPFYSQSQIRGLLRDRAVEAIRGQQEEQKEEETVQEEQRQQNRQGPTALERRMMQAMGLQDVEHEQQYNFTSQVVMDIETVDSEGKKDKMQYTTLFSPGEKNFAMIFDAEDPRTGKQQKSTMIFDLKNGAMLILAEDGREKSGVAMKIGDDLDQQDSSYEQVEHDQPIESIHPLYSPTGKTKTIAGMRCKEFAYSDMEGSVSLWVTDEKSLNFSQAYGHMQGLGALATGGWAQGMGMVMEMIFTDRINGESTHMLVKEVNPNSRRTINLTGYQIIGMGAQP